MIEKRADGLTQRTSRSRRIWTILTIIEILLTATTIILDLLIPTIVILVLATISLAIRRTGPASLGFYRVPRPGQMIISVFMLAIAWTVIQFSLTLPILNHLTGQRQNLNQFGELQGNLAMLLIFLALTWTLAAVGEETVYRGYIPTRIGEVFGQQRAGIVLGVAAAEVLRGGVEILLVEGGVVERSDGFLVVLHLLGVGGKPRTRSEHSDCGQDGNQHMSGHGGLLVVDPRVTFSKAGRAR